MDNFKNIKQIPLSICIILLFNVCFLTITYKTIAQAELKFYRKLPYPKSDFIIKMTWTSKIFKYPGTNSDMHWWTWGGDSAIYVLDDDGKNFGGPDYYAHLLKCTGIPPLHKVETVTDFQDYPFRSQTPSNKQLRRYVCGAMCVKDRLYVCLYDYDWDLKAYPLPKDSLNKWKTMYNPWPNLDDTGLKHLGFIDGYSKLGGVGAIIYSDDYGKTWKNIPDSTTEQFFSPQFGAPAFLTFGPGNYQTPEKLRPYVYAISNDGSWETGNNVFLGRVHQDSILNPKSWQFVESIDKNNNARWTHDLVKSQAIFTDIDHVGHPTITYNSHLSRYILSISSDVVPHHENAGIEGMKNWDIASEMQLYEGPTPWGPWKVFYAEKPWGGNKHTCYIPQIPQAWIQNNGLTGSILFAGDYVKRKGEYYGFMTRGFKLKIAKKK